ncbi:MAG: hypothetical protein GPJ51_08350 [Candidatus Heimdallarchaeota archaeon]|nr:hypothetical protein [Candidatus Heimdallarchaeota archaeon]
MNKEEFNLTYRKLAEAVGKPSHGLAVTIRNTMKEWHEAGIIPKIYKGEVIDG